MRLSNLRMISPFDDPSIFWCQRNDQSSSFHSYTKYAFKRLRGSQQQVNNDTTGNQNTTFGEYEYALRFCEAVEDDSDQIVGMLFRADRVVQPISADELLRCLQSTDNKSVFCRGTSSGWATSSMPPHYQTRVPMQQQQQSTKTSTSGSTSTSRAPEPPIRIPAPPILLQQQMQNLYQLHMQQQIQQQQQSQMIHQMQMRSTSSSRAPAPPVRVPVPPTLPQMYSQMSGSSTTRVPHRLSSPVLMSRSRSRSRSGEPPSAKNETRRSKPPTPQRQSQPQEDREDLQPTGIRNNNLNLKEIILNTRKSSGSYADVYLCEVYGIGKCALKLYYGRIHEEATNAKEVNFFRKMLENHWNHRNIIDCHAIVVDQKDTVVGILMEIMEKDLKTVAKSCQISRNNVIDLFLNITKGLQYLHDNGFVHRDIKPENILINLMENVPADVKICDFGCVVKMDELAGFDGTVEFCAPETFVIDDQIYKPSSDMFALGWTIFEMLHGNSPEFDHYRNSMHHQPLDRPTIVLDDPIQRMIEKLWFHFPESRPTTDQILGELRDLRSAPIIPSSALLLWCGDSIADNDC